MDRIGVPSYTENCPEDMTAEPSQPDKSHWSGTSMADLTVCLQAIEAGDERASEELLPLVYDELRQHAGVRMARESSAHTLQPTALVHEAWLRVVGKGGIRWESRAHFFGAAAEAMRRILIESARRKARLKRGGDMVRVDLSTIDVATATPEEKVLMIDEALEKLKQKDPEQARVVMLKFFMSHTNAEVADMLRISERTVERRWAFAKSWLLDTIKQQQNQPL
ncbi:sigma-70 family RNA polymerase sigma factor [Pelagicoccus sp. SDUM812002]|uniref:sigma-70 family RNA polymerase sigma factor n=1 Tax=Pelagicoccus sp. SDUM812002 TaxID=3041266 RepID=UPI00280D1016|nr:sigma-70 family RNA polymerase sigma factor [Pelagicoccus sp. SDUM812002]MDQ8185013.1 sigma-70 family RNA polymerase sigma factor [Pelagicoccus sp. SDUM812002]